METSKSEVEDLKIQGNNAFQAGNFILAEELYRRAIEIDQNSHILYTNLAAALIEQKRYDEVILTSNKAIEIEKTWVKAYFRKATALEFLGRTQECFYTWETAIKNCEQTTWLQKQYEKSKSRWIKEFRRTPLLSPSDLWERYRLLTDSREKLSTLAHFWNLSTPEERLKHFYSFLRIIGGPNTNPELSDQITVEMMFPMPMHNYPDLPMDLISTWCNFFQSVSSDTKTSILEQFWHVLSSKEQNDVIIDLQLFMSQAGNMVSSTSKTTISTSGGASGSSPGDDDCEKKVEEEF